MRFDRFVVAGACALAIACAGASGASAAAAAAAKGKSAAQSGGFVVRLGADTVSVERWTRTGNRLVVDQVGRAPRVMKRHFEYEYDAKGALTKFTLRVNAGAAAADAPPTQEIFGTCTADSVIADIRTPGRATQSRVALPAGSVLLFSSSPWTQYERLVQRLGPGKADTVRAGVWFVGAPSTGWQRAQRLGRDSVRIENDHADVFHLKVDRAGRVLHARPVSGTGKVTVDRALPDLAAVSAQWVAAEKASGAVGTLSVADSVKVEAGGANLRVDYSRPAKRGRVVFGEVVPYGEVWRTGANAATVLATDKALDFGGTVVPAGKYSVWTLPAKSGWTLILNSQTGQWGTEHDASKDLYKIGLTVEPLPDVVERFTINVLPRDGGGVLQLDWDQTRASVGFAVK
ncbi:MAG: DUF2911 domain-containing protein [Candidatus Eisenbacteria bacterium]|uniref:DUF2911 domain-containing protein n=1 Tax=Eiseniibacteriota bacterium TaxID=2212470 RepID=A0A933SH33_UNCEI|nr:DUF2911 domain-containing protein [Candidatus Eisenbacteria bacterium]